MKLHEIADDRNPGVFHVHNRDDTMGAIKTSLMCDWMNVSLEAHPDLKTDQMDEDCVQLMAIVKKIVKHKPRRLGSMLIHFNLYDSETLKKILDAFAAYFGPGEWRWAVSVATEIA